MHVVSADHSINKDRRERVKYLGYTAFVGILLLLNVTGIFSEVWGVDTAIILALLAGYKTFYNAVSALMDGKISADLAIVIAAIAALSVGEYAAAAEAMFIMLLGEGLEAYAAGRTEREIHRFVEQLPRRARVLRDGEEAEVAVESLVVGDQVIVRAGERIPADGVVHSGQTSVDESPITGESVPRDKGPGDEVYSGTLNGHGLIHLTVSNAAEDSTLARVIHLVEEARTRQAPVVRLADRYAQFFLPALLLAAGLTYYLTQDTLRAVTILIVGCPCALILATPAAMVAAIGGLARRGILVRGGSIVQTGSKIDTVVFDKTGTLTSGKFRILQILAAEGYSEEQVLGYGASAESGSDHPLAKVIVETARERRVAIESSADAHIVPGRGAECHIDGRVVRAGNESFLAEHDIHGAKPYLDEADRGGATAVLVSSDSELVGAILLRDTPREGAVEAVHELEHLGIKHVLLLTGDRRRAADAIAKEVGIHEVEAELLPEQKLDRIRQLQAQGRTVAMVGDGVNDAPALAAANVGVAVAGSGADIAAEAADVVDLNKSLEKFPRLLEVSRDAVAIIWQNIIIFAGVVNVVAVWAAGKGMFGPAVGAGVHQIASLLVMVNSIRLLRIERPRGEEPWYSRWWRRAGAGRVWPRLLHALGHIDPAAGFAWVWERRQTLARPALAALGVLWVLSGVYLIPADEVGVIQRFGRKILPLSQPGFHYKFPFPVDQLTRIKAHQVRSVEIGFRTAEPGQFQEPLSYEWNVQHREGRFQRMPEETLMLTGDQNMIELTAVVHYDLDNPADFLFHLSDSESTVRVASESILHSIVNASPLDSLLTTDRREIERRAADELQHRLAAYQTGVRILGVRLQEVHPSVEVVDAFREVAGALEEKNRLINEAEGYRNEQIALARGQAEARIRNADAYKIGRTNRADGDATRFVEFEQAARANYAATATRLYLETMEQVLPGRQKLIVDSHGGRKALFSIEDGVNLAPNGARMAQPPPFVMPREE